MVCPAGGEVLNRIRFLLAAAAGALASGAAAADRPPQVVYAQTCGYCHGANVGPVIRGRGIDAGAIVYIVRHGQNAMPAFRQTEIGPSELDALAGWIEQSAADPAERGR